MNTTIDLSQREAIADGLVGREWTDANGHTWYVRGARLDERKNDYELRIVRRGTGVGRWQTIEQVQGYLQANTEHLVQEGVTLAEKSAHNDQDNAEGGFAITGMACRACQKVVYCLLGTADPICPDCEKAEPVDPELANAGSIEDEQLRNRQLNPDSVQPKALTVEEAAIDAVNAKLRELQAAITKHGGKGAVTLKITVKRGDEPRELEIGYEIGLTPPKIKETVSFWDGIEIIPGVRKREPDDQMTITDAGQQTSATGPVVDDEDQADEPEVNPEDHDPTDEDDPPAELGGAIEDGEVVE